MWRGRYCEEEVEEGGDMWLSGSLVVGGMARGGDEGTLASVFVL